MSAGASAVDRRWVGLTFLLLFLPRAIYALEEVAYIHPDVLGQAIEPAYRAVHGAGRVSWEFTQGVRSWIWPGVLTPIFWLCEAFGLSGPGIGTRVPLVGVNLLCAAIDAFAWAFVAWVGAAAVFDDPRVQRRARWTTVGLGATQAMWLLPGSQAIIGVPAGAALAVAGALSLRRWRGRPARRFESFATGAALAATLLLRIQLAPVVAFAGLLVLHALRTKSPPSPGRSASPLAELFAGAVLVAAVFGLVDWITWGAPWASTLRYLEFSFTRSDEVFGRMPADRYFVHAWSVGSVGFVLIVLAALAQLRSHWPLALIPLVAFLPHQLVGQKQLHFLHPLGPWLGLAAAATWAQLYASLAPRLSPAMRRAADGLIALALLLGGATGALEGSYWKSTWLFHQGGEAAIARSRALNRAYLQLAEAPLAELRVAQAVLPAAASPDMAHLGHPVPSIPLLEQTPDARLGPADLLLTWGELPPASLPPGFRPRAPLGPIFVYTATRTSPSR